MKMHHDIGSFDLGIYKTEDGYNEIFNQDLEINNFEIIIFIWSRQS